MRMRSFGSWMAAGALVAGVAVAGAPARAAIIIDAATSGTGKGASYAGGPLVYANFNNLTPGSSASGTSGGIAVSFTGGGNATGKAVTGNTSGEYAPPFLTGSNGTNFGGGLSDGYGSGNQTVNIADATVYLTSGTTAGTPPGSAILTFSSQQSYLGILWGSVDTYNTLTFYNGNTKVGEFTGDAILNPANGFQGNTGTSYVNFVTNGGTTFNKVVATSSQFAFEFDNVAYAVPEPGTAVMGLTAAGLGGLVALRRRSKKTPVVA